MAIEIYKKPSTRDEYRSIKNVSDVYHLKEVQEIKDAVQEHLLFIGLNSRNNIRHIGILSIGNENMTSIDSKHIIGTAITNACNKVILVHNHPSNSLEISKHDKYLTNVTSALMHIFNIELLDHLIVTEEEYTSMKSQNAIDYEYSDEKLDFINKALLYEENQILKAKLAEFENIRIFKKEEIQINDEEEFEL